MFETGNEVGIRPVPKSTHIETIQGATVRVETVPRDIIADIVVNPIALDYLHPKLRHLCSEEYILSSCKMALPPRQHGENNILTPWYWGRAIPLHYGFIPYADYIGGIVMGKGCSLTGEKFIESSSLDRFTPWGFFGRRDAEKEIAVGNDLLNNGFRASLPLWYVVFDNEKLSSWLGSFYSSAPQIGNIVQENLRIVTGNNDNAVFLARVTGVSERILWEVRHEMNERILKRRKGEMRRAARLLNKEALLFPDHFKNYLNDRGERSKVVGLLGDISKGKDFKSREELMLYAKLVAGILRQNQFALVRMVDKQLEGPLGSYLETNLGKVVGALKDVDFDLLSQDYEELKPYGRSDVEEDYRRKITDLGKGLCMIAEYFFLPRTAAGDTEIDFDQIYYDENIKFHNRKKY